MEVVNKDLVQGLNVNLNPTGGSWVEELPNILWSYHTTPQERISMTPFHLVYEGEAYFARRSERYWHKSTPIMKIMQKNVRLNWTSWKKPKIEL